MIDIEWWQNMGMDYARGGWEWTMRGEEGIRKAEHGMSRTGNSRLLLQP
jgi:hypothetical protein